MRTSQLNKAEFLTLKVGYFAIGRGSRQQNCCTERCPRPRRPADASPGHDGCVGCLSNTGQRRHLSLFCNKCHRPKWTGISAAASGASDSCCSTLHCGSPAGRPSLGHIHEVNILWPSRGPAPRGRPASASTRADWRLSRGLSAATAANRHLRPAATAIAPDVSLALRCDAPAASPRRPTRDGSLGSRHGRGERRRTVFALPRPRKASEPGSLAAAWAP